MPKYLCPQCERVFSHRASLQNHVRSHDSIVDRVLREIADEVEEEVIHKEEVIREQLIEIDANDNEQEDANDDKQKDTRDDKREDTSDDEQEDVSDNERQIELSDNERQIELSDNEH